MVYGLEAKVEGLSSRAYVRIKGLGLRGFMSWISGIGIKEIGLE